MCTRRCVSVFLCALVYGVKLRFDTDALCGFAPIAARRVINCVSEVVFRQAGVTEAVCQLNIFLDN